MADRKIMQATESFSVYLKDGTPFVVVVGELFHSDDPVVVGREHLFGELTVRSSQPARRASAGDSETASAAPGSRRAMSRPNVKDGGKTDA
jgi:hypothetical protein